MLGESKVSKLFASMTMPREAAGVRGDSFLGRSEEDTQVDEHKIDGMRGSILRSARFF